MSKILEIILDTAPDLIDETDKDGFTPLMHAAAHSNENCISALLGRGANRSARDNQGRTAADIAQEAGHLQTVTLLS
jgi:ankyrin repeat protein